MSIYLMAQIWDNADPDLSGNKLLIALCLADYANDDGVCWPSLTRLAKRTRIDRRNVIRNIRALQEMGYLEITRAPGKSNRYTIRATRTAAQASSDRSATSGKNVTSDKFTTSTSGKIITGVVVNLSPESSYNRQYESSRSVPSDDQAKQTAAESAATNAVAGESLVDPDLQRALDTWQAAFAGTRFGAMPPVHMLPKWLAWYGPDVLCYMIEQAKDKKNPTGWLYTTYDNWRKDGEVAPHIAKQVNAARLAAAPVVTKTMQVDFGDGLLQTVEVATRGA